MTTMRKEFTDLALKFCRIMPSEAVAKEMIGTGAALLDQAVGREAAVARLEEFTEDLRKAEAGSTAQ